MMVVFHFILWKVDFIRMYMLQGIACWTYCSVQGPFPPMFPEGEIVCEYFRCVWVKYLGFCCLIFLQKFSDNPLLLYIVTVALSLILYSAELQ